ncbi:rhodanese-like domain-containing protein [Halobacteria archaeon AArc-curdl1]|uniref:Rhodanese-like domain-containing protein n=1 Tax=Natronosalvus hydrolyticus TaxID=2979988 RepID=A0AAP2ZDJ5_9EURY|nr:rhodanese-like domain-containing protein [Halobacteria archaeon AArc-curdl1]
MKRRELVAVAGSLSLGGLAGCLGGFDDESSNDWPSSYDTANYEDVTVPLVPLEDAFEWYEAGDTRYVDTRGPGQYASAHIAGAVLSSAPDGEEDDPTEDWGLDTRIVTYCDCPHSLATMRASRLRQAGFESVYALDDGFPAWRDAGHPVETDEGADSVATYEIVGRSSPDHAEEYVWLSTVDGAQREITQVQADGSYELTVRFSGVDRDTVLALEAPEYELEATLEELTAGVVTA